MRLDYTRSNSNFQLHGSYSHLKPRSSFSLTRQQDVELEQKVRDFVVSQVKEEKK